MANNKISLDRFFEVGGICEVRCCLRGDNMWRIYYPESTKEFNDLMLNALWPNIVFRWNGWVYRPVFNFINKSYFHYLEAYERDSRC